MTQPFPIEPQLFEVYAWTFDLLIKCLLVSVAALFAASVLWIVLCCWEETRKNRSVKAKTAPAPEQQADSAADVRAASPIPSVAAPHKVLTA